MSQHRAFSTALAALLLLSRAARADDTDELRSLLDENVITTASTAAQTGSSAPATSTTLTAEDLRTYGIRSLDDAINFLSLGVITANPLSAVDIGARGVFLPNDAGRHVLLLVNGHAINDPLIGAARFDQGAGIPLESIDHVEIIVGPGSVLYGSNAMLGVINVITKQAEHAEGSHVVSEYEPGRSLRVGAGAGYTFSLFGAPSSLTTELGYYYRFGPSFDFGLQNLIIEPSTGTPLRYRRDRVNDGYWGGKLDDAYFSQVPSGMLQLKSGDFEVNVMGSMYRRGIPFTRAGLTVDFDDPDSYDLDRALRADVKHQANLSSNVQLTTRVYADSFDYQRRVNRWAPAACYTTELETCQRYTMGIARWAGIEMRVAIKWLGDSRLTTLAGIDARSRWVEGKEDTLDFDTGRPIGPSAGLIRENGRLVSPYLQQTWAPTPWLDFNGGVRLDADPRYDPIFSPRIAGAVRPWQGGTFKAIYSQAFRAPGWAETESTGLFQTRAPNLEPETVHSLEGSFEQHFGAQRLFFGVFRSRWENMIEPHVLTLEEIADYQARGELPLTTRDGTVQHRNVARIENYGWNAAFSGSAVRGKLHYGTNLTAAYTRKLDVTDQTELLAGAPRLFGNARVAYTLGGYWPTPALAAYYVPRRPIDRAFDASFVPAPYAPALLELRATVSGEVPAVNGLSYRVSCSYASAAHGAYAAGARQRIIAGDPNIAPDLNPIDRFSVLFGLRYDFGRVNGGASSGEAP